MQSQAPCAFPTGTPSTRRLLDGVAVHRTHWLIRAQASGPCQVSDDLPEDTALRVIGLPFAFALIIIIGSQFAAFQVGGRVVFGMPSKVLLLDGQTSDRYIVDGVVSVVVDALGGLRRLLGRRAAPREAREARERVARMRARLHVQRQRGKASK